MRQAMLRFMKTVSCRQGLLLVRILSVTAESLNKITVKADVKSMETNTSKENMKKCKIQGKYAGTVGKKDEVSFVVTHIDEDRNMAVGLISRIIRQNL